MGRAKTAALLAALVLATLTGCGGTNACKDGTAFLTISYSAGLPPIDTLTINVTVTGVGTTQFTRPRSAGPEDAFEIDFPPGGYVAGAAITVTVTGTSKGALVAAGTLPATPLASGCSAIEVALTVLSADAAAPVDLLASDSGALPDAASPADALVPDLAPGVDFTPQDFPAATDRAYSDQSAPDLAMPDSAMPDLAMPDLALPDLALPDLAMPDFALPDLIVVPPDLFTPDKSGPLQLSFSGLKTTATPGCYGLTVADLDGTGSLDLLLTGISGTLTSATSVGDGTVTLKTQLSGLGGPSDLHAGDFNGDGRQDAVFAASYGGHVSVFFGNGDGTLTTSPQLIPTGSYNPMGIGVADFNHDGKSDIAIAELCPGPCTTLGVVLGSASLGSPSQYSILDGAWRIATGAVVDKGKIDLVTVSYLGSSSQATRLPGNGDGTFGNPVGVPFQQSDLDVIALADFNGDGHLDLLVAPSGTNPMVAVALGNGSGGFASATNTGSLCANCQSIGVADFAGDGRLDIVMPQLNGAQVSLGVGDGTFRVGPMIGTGGNPAYVTAGDITGDGKADVLICSLANVLQVAVNTSH